nr:hypothetical protein Iba_chr03bCG13250 [Ipomoea batatas]
MQEGQAKLMGEVVEYLNRLSEKIRAGIDMQRNIDQWGNQKPQTLLITPESRERNEGYNDTIRRFLDVISPTSDVPVKNRL